MTITRPSRAQHHTATIPALVSRDLPKGTAAQHVQGLACTQIYAPMFVVMCALMCISMALVGCESTPARDRGESDDADRTVLPALAAAEASGSAGSPAGRSSGTTPWRSAQVIVSTEPWDFFGTKGQTIQTPSYRLFTTERSPIFLERLPGFVELALYEYRHSLTSDPGGILSADDPLPAPRKQMVTYLMDNRPQWARLTRALTGERAETYLQIDRGGYAFDGKGVYFDIGLSDTLNIAAHEGWHQYTQSAFRAGLPISIEEGIATYMEGYRWDTTNPNLPLFRPWANPDRFDQLRRAHGAGRLLTLAELLDTRPQDLLESRGPGTLDFYAQVWSLIHFLREGSGGAYRGGFERLLRDAASGAMPAVVLADSPGRETQLALVTRRGSAVFRAYINADVDIAGREYTAFIEALVQPGARDAISAGRSPIR